MLQPGQNDFEREMLSDPEIAEKVENTEKIASKINLFEKILLFGYAAISLILIVLIKRLCLPIEACCFYLLYMTAWYFYLEREYLRKPILNCIRTDFIAGMASQVMHNRLDLGHPSREQLIAMNERAMGASSMRSSEDASWSTIRLTFIGFFDIGIISAMIAWAS